MEKYNQEDKYSIDKIELNDDSSYYSTICNVSCSEDYNKIFINKSAISNVFKKPLNMNLVNNSNIKINKSHVNFESSLPSFRSGENSFKLPFKNKNFVSKYRNTQQVKSLKGLMTTSLDLQSFNTCNLNIYNLIL